MLLSDFLFPRFLVFPPANPSNFSHRKCFSIRIIYLHDKRTCLTKGRPAKEAKPDQRESTVYIHIYNSCFYAHSHHSIHSEHNYNYSICIYTTLTSPLIDLIGQQL